MRTVVIFITLLFLTACADGRWVAHDLSSFSFRFDLPAPPGPFAKARPAAVPLPSTTLPVRVPARSMVAATGRDQSVSRGPEESSE